MMPPRACPSNVVRQMDVPSMITTTTSSRSHTSADLHESLTVDAMDFDHDSHADTRSDASSSANYSHPDSCRIEESPSFGTTIAISHITPASTPRTSASSQQNVRVNVGGEYFSFPESSFQRFHCLPWKRNVDGVLHLNSTAAVFEVLLDYVLFETLPAYDTMSKDEFQEFETMALSMGGLTKLIEHFDRKDSYLAKELRQRRSFSFNSKKQGNFLLNGEQSHKSPNSVRATQCARFLGAICGVAESMRRRPRQAGSGDPAVVKRLKLGPGKWCHNAIS
ncbi:expressed unknown protein [Seminavis robusta]|uniref:Uncharacterized protein n=1 Tax=Seminavis robusta TaxID=568900 RepID=A0A9N8EM45_9STRA|nr:expressed unknown protein [Seminavis robusta]|eukprot:Sro1236_g255080.1 n/a (279) ;mRNA; r:5940-6776